jgi:Fe-Mn family superoxide dismutase
VGPRRSRAPHQRRDDRVPLRQASRGLRNEAQRRDRGHRPREQVAAQVWNHTFYWNSIKPGGGGQPSGAIADAINGSFGSYDKFREEFSNAAATQFGSGWAWLVAEGDKLAIKKTPNAETPITTSAKPLLTIDVWEHAYYIDYRNARPNYIKTFLDSLVNWDFANQNLNG